MTTMTETNNKQKKLQMSFDPQTIEHLGVKMYSQLPNAIAELIANSYDAESPEVHIILTDNEKGKSITVSDKGIGMSFAEINDNFLRIGRKRRESDNGLSPNGLRKVTGRKGLGKLAFFGIGDSIRIITKKNGYCVNFTLNWNDIIHSKTPNYEPQYTIDDCAPQEHGTTIVLTNLKRKTAFDAEGLACSLASLFDFFDDAFKADIKLNDNAPISIDKTLRYRNIDSQFTWSVPGFIENREHFFYKKKISGELLATEKPLKPGLRGITLYAHGRMVNAPEFFGVGESSHFYSYLTGWLDVDFIDEQEEDIISTDRQSLSWDLPITSELRYNLKQLLSSVERNWRDKRKTDRQRNLAEKTKIDVEKWYPTLTSDIKQGVEKIVDSVVESSEFDSDKQKEVVEVLHSPIPEYAQYHWRHLHQIVKGASYLYYKNADFYWAVYEAIKRFQAIVQEKSNSNQDGQRLMLDVFGSNGCLSVSSNYKKKNGADFSESTKKNIEEGQKFMSAGMMSGVRNPIAHEEVAELQNSGLFTENDCLDMLSLLSHLCRRLDDAIKKK
ncbi:TIGR02391 family protein [Succinivibrio dextrinosolvens DSM 3072]|uniref:TIGR02391 family protein n=2 Tax=Succinivibrio dextrinosolvens TaxID=83771 RepID=A0A1T4VH93_9GAMM|nr:TIGR02391 family protein [Succinivibrio dextrinosolvens DSM 3072]